MSSDVLTARQVAEELDRSYATVLRWIKAGTLKGWKLGGQYRVKRAEVDRLLNGEAA